MVTPDSIQVKFFFGFLTTSTGAFSNTTDPLANKSGIGLWYDATTTATNYKVIHNSGGANSVKDDFGIGGATTTAIDTANPHDWEIIGDDANSRWIFSYDGASNYFSSTIPATTTDMGWWLYIVTTEAVLKDLLLNALEFEVN